jgi:hypothetical protein
MGRTVAEIVQFNNFSNSTMKHDAFIAGGGLMEDFGTNSKEHRRRSDTLDDTNMVALE